MDIQKGKAGDSPGIAQDNSWFAVGISKHHVGLTALGCNPDSGSGIGVGEHQTRAFLLNHNCRTRCSLGILQPQRGLVGDQTQGHSRPSQTVEESHAGLILADEEPRASYSALVIQKQAGAVDRHRQSCAHRSIRIPQNKLVRLHSPLRF